MRFRRPAASLTGLVLLAGLVLLVGANAAAQAPDEPGVVSFSGNPAAGTALAASLSDPDGSVTDESWLWSRSATADGTFLGLTGNGFDTASYTPQSADHGFFLKATVSYTDGHGGSKTASAVTDVRVDELVLVSNAAQTPADRVRTNIAPGNEFGVCLGQSFTTGSHSAGYRFGAVDLWLSGAGEDANAVVDIRPHVNGGPAGRFESPNRQVYAALGSVEVDTATETRFWIGADDVLLDSDTVYWITMCNQEDFSSRDFWSAATESNDQDTQGQSGWGIGDNVFFLPGTGSVTWVDMSTIGNASLRVFRNVRLRVTGYEREASSPEFSVSEYPSDEVELTVEENTTSGDVEGPITATDVDLDVLTYSVAATGRTGTALAHLAAFKRDFVLDPVSGQISVNADAMIDFERLPMYRVLYRVTDGENSSGAAERTARIDDTLTLTVTVTDTEEPGVVSFRRNPNVGTRLTASLSDSDGDVTITSWQWSRSPVPDDDSMFVPIAGETAASYTPVTDDHDYFLKATVSYEDRLPGGKTASAVTEVRVDELVLVSNAAQTPADRVRTNITTTDEFGVCLGQSFTTGSHSAGYRFGAVELWLSRDENDATVVVDIRPHVNGGPAGKFDTPNRQVYAALGSVNAVTATETRFWFGADDVLLDSDTVYWITMCNEEGRSNRNFWSAATESDGQDVQGQSGWGIGDNVFYLPGTGSEFWADMSTIGNEPLQVHRNVRLRVTGYERQASSPEFSVADYPDDEAELTVEENTTSGAVGGPITATDVDMDDLTYSVAATGRTRTALAHLAAFNRDFVLGPVSGQISVNADAMIDFERLPSYKVRYRVTDGEDSSGAAERTARIDDTLTLTITVTDTEDPGVVSFDRNPDVGTELTASLSDSDGDVTGTSWQWSRSATAGGTFSDLTGNGAGTVSYTPQSADDGSFLKATASYTDRLGGGKTASAVTVFRVDVLPEVSLSESALSVREAATAVRFTVVVSEVSERPVTVKVLTADGTARAGSDYPARRGTEAQVTLPPYQDRIVVDVEILDDERVEVDETFTVMLEADADSNATVDGTAATVTIIDNEGDPALSITGASAAENTPEIVFAVALTPASADAVTVAWETADRSATAGSDYTAASGTLFFAPGETGKTVTVTLMDDIDVEGTETFTVTLSEPTNARIRFSATTAVGTVRDNERRPGNTGSGGSSGSGGGSSGGGGGGGGGGGLDTGFAVFVVANGWSAADVGVASVMSARMSGAVVVYTAGDVLSDGTAALLREASPAAVIIVGGTGAVSRDVRTQIVAASPESDISRVSGAGRADTAAGTARRTLGAPSEAGRVTLIVVNGWSPPDIGAAAALAARTARSAVVYTEAARLPDASAALLRDYEVARVILVGGAGAINSGVQEAIAVSAGGASVLRLTGADRINTAALAARRVLGSPAGAAEGLTLVVANGWSAPDVGVGAAFAAATSNAAVAFTSPAALPEATAALIREYRPSQVVIVGGSAAVTGEVRDAITQAAPDGASVRRITGSSRTDTAARAARRILAGL